MNSDALKPEHRKYLQYLVENLALDRQPPRGHIRLVEGYSDLVDTEQLNRPLRQRRSEAVAQFLNTTLHVPAENVDVVKAAPPGLFLAGNLSREGRARNRAVIIELEEIETDTQMRSRYWGRRSTATGAIGDILGGGGGLFYLVDLTASREQGERMIGFYGVGLVGGASVKGLPPRIVGSLTLSLTEFETIRPHSFEDFEGPGFIDFMSFDVVAYGYQLGYAHFAGVKTIDRNGIWIGGHQAGGLGISGAILPGRWKFLT